MTRAAKSRTGPRERPTLLSFRDGNDTLVQALAAKIGSGLRLNAEVVTIGVARDGTARKFEVRVWDVGGEETFVADRLVLATPTDMAGEIFGGGGGGLGRRRV